MGSLPESACCAATDSPEAIRAAFDEHGFVGFRGFLSPGEAGDALAAADALTAALPAGADAFYDDVLFPRRLFVSTRRRPRRDAQVRVPATLKQIQRVDAHSAFFRRLLEARLAPVVEAALGERAFAQNMQYFDKPGTVCYAASGVCAASRPTPPHQDAAYFMVDPPSAATLWLALDDADDANGCLRYVAGSRHGGLRPHDFSDVKGFSRAIADYGAADAAREVVAACAAGDLLVHHALTIHRAPPDGCTHRRRRAVGAVFYGASAAVDARRVAARAAEIRARAARLPGQRAT